MSRSPTSMDAPPSPVVQTLAILSESNRFITTNSLHFLALSLVLVILLPLISPSFLLPIGYLYITVDFTHSQLFTGTKYYSPIFTYNYPHHLLLRLPFLYTFLISPFTLSAFSVMNHNTFHRFNGRPFKLFSSIELSSWFPLIITFFIAQFCQYFICLYTPIFLFRLSFQVFEKLGFEIDFDSDTMNVCYLLLKLVIQLLFISFQVIWILAPVVVVAELKWGLGPLWRSLKLFKRMKTMRSVPLLLVLFYGALTEILVWCDLNTSDCGWPFTLRPVLMTLVLLHLSASINVLFVRVLEA